MRATFKTVLACVTLTFRVLPGFPLQAEDKPPVPDFTKGGKPDKTHDWTLGPTGARGWVWGWKGQTTDARQVLITDVAPGSPADGVLRKDDVLLGVDGKPFSNDARIMLGKAITEAEKKRGILSLVCWRDGQTQNMEVKLHVLGSYSPTAPYDCPKSKRIIEQGCLAIAQRGWKDKRGNVAVSIINDLNALALLASGREEYRPLAAEYARKVADHTPGGHISWGYAYETLFLAEYALATRDETVMPGLRRLALDIARGASGVGTWGHSFARRPDGILNGYGCMSQPGIALTIAMIVAREAGIKDADLDRAIARASGFLRWYVNKGAIPYGDHDPWPWHDDNGKCSSAAVLFDLLGDRKAALFFAKMGTAAHGERESGHTGNFFNMLWALPGVSRCGPQATGAYLEEQAWYYDLARRWDGSFLYQGTPGNWGGHQYGNWDCTGAYLLAYTLALKNLCITGKKQCAVTPLSRDEAIEVIAAGRDFTFWTEKTCYQGRTTEALLAGLSSWSPAVRKRSAQALGAREGNFVPRLLELLAGTKPDARYGACEAMGCLGPRADAAAPQVRALLNDRDPWVRILAAEALVRMGPEIRKAVVPDLLRAITVRNPADRRNRAQSAFAEALFTPGPGKREPKAILADSLDGVDRALLYAAIRDLLGNEDGRIRGLVAPAYKMLSARDTAALLPDIAAAIRNPAPSGEMFAYGIRMSGLELLAKFRIREGMSLCVDIMNERRWGRDFFRAERALRTYGGAAKVIAPRLQKETREIAAKQDEKHLKALEKLIADIEADASPKPVRGMADFINNPTDSM